MSPQSSAESDHELPQSHCSSWSFFIFKALEPSLQSVSYFQRGWSLLQGRQRAQDSACTARSHSSCTVKRIKWDTALPLPPSSHLLWAPSPKAPNKNPHTPSTLCVCIVPSLENSLHFPGKMKLSLNTETTFKASSAARSHKVQFAVWSVFYTV